MQKRLNGYKGKLSPSETADGMNAAAANAVRLAADARLLLESKRFPSAASLAILSVEESGKTSILRELSLARTDEERLNVWKSYRSHTKKNAAWILPELASDGARTLDDLRPMFDESSEHPYVLDQLKQMAFYTDCLGKRHWSVPEDVIEEQTAAALVAIAEVFASDRSFTPQEVELWVQHVGPVWKCDPAWMKQALVNWATAMYAAGLAGPPDGMERFLRGQGDGSEG